jgi:hypothetical protein
MATKSNESISMEAWEQAWQKHWQKVGFSPYELHLPDTNAANRERNFLTEKRSPEREKARLKRITAEFERGFKRLGKLGPAVTVFGSARFKPGHPYYELAREVGRELALAGFATITGGGPGAMEAANRGAHEAGGPSYGLNIILPHEQAANPYVDESVEFQYFFVRKVMLVKYSCAYIVMPGGRFRWCFSDASSGSGCATICCSWWIKECLRLKRLALAVSSIRRSKPSKWWSAACRPPYANI